MRLVKSRSPLRVLGSEFSFVEVEMGDVGSETTYQFLKDQPSESEDEYDAFG
jgi:hypothetical protein